MRNTQCFDINIYEDNFSTGGVFDTINSYLEKLPSPEQQRISESPFLRKISLARNKWQEVSDNFSSQLNEFFSSFSEEYGGLDYGNPHFHGKYDAFGGGKYWQMFDYLDGRIMDVNNLDCTREEYQDRLFMEYILGFERNHKLLQTGFDLAVNSALLCDLMPNPRTRGSIFLLENVLEKEDSFLYSAIDEGFQERVVNDAFWQSLFNVHESNNIQVLEKTLTRYFNNLDSSKAEDNILRWGKMQQAYNLGAEPLVVGDSGSDSFSGLSKRAVKNYGRFLVEISHHNPFSQEEHLKSLSQEYFNSLYAKDLDGIEYFTSSERNSLKFPELTKFLSS